METSKFLDLMMDEIKAIRLDVKDIGFNGCSKRDADVIRVENIEENQRLLVGKLDKLFYTTLASAVGIIAFLIKAFLPYILSK